MLRADREDLSRQEAAVVETRVALATALDDLEREAKAAARAARTKRGTPDLDAVSAAHRAVQRAEELHDLAVYDLRTAGGADG